MYHSLDVVNNYPFTLSRQSHFVPDRRIFIIPSKILGKSFHNHSLILFSETTVISKS